MADDKNKDPQSPAPVTLKPGEVVVDQKTLTNILEGQAKLETALANETSKREGLEAMFASKDTEAAMDEKGLRRRRNFEPAFRTVAIKKLSIGENAEDFRYVIGYTDRGAYPVVDRTGVAPIIVDFIDVILLGAERTDNGKLQSVTVPLLTLINSPEVNCKVLETKDYTGKPFRLTYPATGQGEQLVPTGEEIAATTLDPKHGLVTTGEIIDGFVGFTNLTFVIQIPGVADPLEIDQKYVNI